MARLAELHALIHSLGKSEKRFLRLALNSGKKSQPEHLLDILTANIEFDESTVVAALHKKKLNERLPTHMQRLRKTIVRQLLSLGTDRTIDAQLSYAIGEINLLFNKKLLDQMPGRIKRARKLAVRFSRFSQQLDLIDLERRLRLETEPSRIQETYRELREEELEVLRAMVLQREVADVHVRMRSLSRESFQANTEAERERFSNLGQHPSLYQALKSADFLTRTYALNALGLYFIGIKELDEANKQYIELMEQWKSDPAWINVQPDLFLVSFNNYYTVIMISPGDDLSMPEEYARFFDRQQFEDPFVRLRFNRIYFGKEMAIFLNRGKFIEGQGFVLDFRNWLEEVKDQLPKATLIPMYYNLAVFYFFGGNLSKANQMVQAILGLEGEEQRKDIRSFAMLLELVLHWDLGDHDFVEYRFRSVKRKLKVEAETQPLITALLNFFKIQRTNEQERYQKLYSDLEAVSGGAFGLNEMLLWVTSKLEERPLAQVFREATGIEG